MRKKTSKRYKKLLDESKIKKIETLEDKVSINLDEGLYSELLSLRNQLKEG